MCYQILINLVDVKFDDFFQYSTVVMAIRFLKSDVNAKISFFGQRIVNVWNSLQPEIVDFGSLRSFKRLLRQ